MTALLGLVVFASAVAIDFAHARCIVAIGGGAGQRAARWSIVQWAASTVGILVAFKVTLWVLPCEASGLYVGTLLAVRTQRRHQLRAERSLSAAAYSQADEDIRAIPLTRPRLVRSGYDTTLQSAA
jgi:hypothetical protein